jgi:hypothetical protein
MSAPDLFRCRRCGESGTDRRWAPLCPACRETDHAEQRRLQARPPPLDVGAWPDPIALETAFERVLGPPLP